MDRKNLLGKHKIMIGFKENGCIKMLLEMSPKLDGWLTVVGVPFVYIYIYTHNIHIFFWGGEPPSICKFGFMTD